MTNLKEIIFGRIAAYEIAFGNRPTGRSSPTFIGYFSRDEIVLMGFMGLNEVTDPARLMAYHKMEADRQGTDWFGPNTPRFAALGEKLPLFGYGFLAYGDGWCEPGRSHAQCYCLTRAERLRGTESVNQRFTESSRP